MSVSTVHVSVLLSVVCLGVVFVGGWYLQSSLMEVNTLVMEQHYHNQEQTKQIEELNKQIIKQNDQITQQHLQLEQLNIIINVLLNNNGKYKDHYETTDNITHHGILKREEQSTQTTQTDKTIIKLLQGRDGRDGRDGLKGIKGDVGQHGEKGDQGKTGQKGEPAGGVVYVRWGHDSCPSTGAQLVYSGRAGGSLYSHSGGGSNPQCLPLDPNYLNHQPGKQTNSYMYGAEYELTNRIVANSFETDVPCAVCYVPTRSTLYMMPAKYTCPKDWTTEYYGYLMAERNHPSHHRSQFTCIDQILKSVIGTSYNHNGLLFYPVEGRCGSLPCPPYEETKELTCAVCTK